MVREYYDYWIECDNYKTDISLTSYQLKQPPGSVAPGRNKLSRYPYLSIIRPDSLAVERKNSYL